MRNKYIFTAFLLFFIISCLSCIASRAISRRENEKEIFAFDLDEDNKHISLSICEEQPDYMVFRITSNNKNQITYPRRTKDSWSKFTYSYYFRGGGANNEGLDLNYLSFIIDNKTYKLYDEYSAVNDHTLVGLIIENIETEEKIDYRDISNSRKGSLIELRYNDKILHESD